MIKYIKCYFIMIFTIMILCLTPIISYCNNIVLTDINNCKYNIIITKENKLNKITIGNNIFYIEANYKFRSGLLYAYEFNSFNPICSEAIKINKYFYKYDIYKDNIEDDVTLVFYKFRDEMNGKEVAFKLSRQEIKDIINEIKKVNGIK